MNIEDFINMLDEPLNSLNTNPMVLNNIGIHLEKGDEGHPEDSFAYCALTPLGIDIMASDTKIIDSVFFYYNEGESDYICEFGFKNGIYKNSSRSDVRELFGEPSKCHEDPVPTHLGIPATGPWDRFDDIFDCKLHIRYTENANSIDRITLMSKSKDI